MLECLQLDATVADFTDHEDEIILNGTLAENMHISLGELHDIFRG